MPVVERLDTDAPLSDEIVVPVEFRDLLAAARSVIDCTSSDSERCLSALLAAVRGAERLGA